MTFLLCICIFYSIFLFIVHIFLRRFWERMVMEFMEFYSWVVGMCMILIIGAYDKYLIKSHNNLANLNEITGSLFYNAP